MNTNTIFKDKKVKYNDVTICVGKSRFETKWKNIQITYKEFIEKLEITTRTRESFKEYRAMSKADKGNAKDVGGFIGGALNKGRRKAGEIQFRSMLTLDLDSIDIKLDSLWSSITMLTNYEVLAYTTHSHSPKSPRIRLIIPLNRNVTPEEYEAIGRKIADDIGMKYFDKTTFEPHRLMYWPSTSSDGEYKFLRREGVLLDADEVLDSYVDWKDTSFWPGLTNYRDDIFRKIKTQEDPLSKSGVIGAYCKSYSITEAIEKELSDIYTVVPGNDDRYTFIGGSTTGGLVIYEDKFAYSHHSTDPINGILVNAFDLVRLHKWGAMDENAKEGTPINKLPSFIKMSEYAVEDERVKKVLIKEQTVVYDELDYDGTIDDSWKSELEVDKKGKIKSTISNIKLILENDINTKGKVIYNEFSDRVSVVKRLKWKKEINRDWEDTDDSGVRDLLEKSYGVTGVQKINDAVSLFFETNKVHPIREYLKGLKWDGVKRVETLLTEYLGVEDNKYTREIIKVHLAAAVARIMRPGIKYDYILTLLGKQGAGKSTFIRILCGNDHFNDSIQTIQGKETYELLRGAWHIELGEMTAIKKAEKEKVKQFITQVEDVYRSAYARRTKRHKRQCIFWGTGNDLDFLRDSTGERRYLPCVVMEWIPTKNIFTDLEKERDQIWAEAVNIYENGQKLYLSGEIEQMAEEKREEHKEDNPKLGLIEDFVNTKVPADWYSKTIAERRNWWLDLDELEYDSAAEEEGYIRRDKICVLEVWCELYGKRKTDIGYMDSLEIRNLLKRLKGWEPIKRARRFGGEYGTQRGVQRK